MGFFDFFTRKKSLSAPSAGRGWLPLTVDEPFTGAWQMNCELHRTDMLSYHTVFACLSLISGDIGKLRFVPKSRKDGVLQQTASRIDRLLGKPNSMQTWQQFAECWILSKLSHGNTYIYKQRDIFGDVWQLVVLNPERVTPLISDDGQVFYRIHRDKTHGITGLTLPASEIIHDRFNCLYHSLVGISPITASAISISQGSAIQASQTTLFQNAARPGGVLSVPTAITREKAEEIKMHWNKTYQGLKQGGIAVLGDGAKYEGITMSSSDTQMIEQLKMTAEIICSVFHVPAFKIGIGTIPAGQKVSDLNEIYYSDCLQALIEAMENLIDSELLGDGVEIEADLSSLIRMDGASQMAYLKEGTLSGIMSPNEARATLGLAPVVGGESPLMQQQNYSLAALARRDSPDNSLNTMPNIAQNDAKAALMSHYKGVFSSDVAYQVGDFVTRNGSLWHCKSACQGDFNHENWTLAVKKGAADELCKP